MKPLATDTFDFETLVRGTRRYVDKTAGLHKLVSRERGDIFFMSRPRRFGKSLMLSTLKAIFEGRRDLFAGLAIDSLPYDWKPHPVLSLTMTSVASGNIRDLRSNMNAVFEDLSAKAGAAFERSDSPAANFNRLLNRLIETSPTGKIVVLVDEYDAPVSHLLGKPEAMEEARELMHEVYVKLKDHSSDIRFLMMTGVSKFTKLSVFSGLNNLTDISADPDFADLLGYTHAELDGALADLVADFAARRGQTPAQARADLLSWYDGYRFSPDSETKICNPVSLGKALSSGKLSNYWEATGRATIVFNALRAEHEIPADLNGLVVRTSDLDVCDARTMPLRTLLFQSGYLTIDSADADGLLTLRIPNKEIDDSLHYGFAAELLGRAYDNWSDRALRAQIELRKLGMETLLQRNLKAMFAAVPHEWKFENEAETKRYFLLFLKFIGANISGERQSLAGRADAVLEDKTGVYVFEFKYGKSAAAALEQARGKDYAGPWLASGKPVHLVGVNYDPAARSIDEPLVEAVS